MKKVKDKINHSTVRAALPFVGNEGVSRWKHRNNRCRFVAVAFSFFFLNANWSRNIKRDDGSSRRARRETSRGPKRRKTKKAKETSTMIIMLKLI